MYFMARTQVAFSVYIIRLDRCSVEDADTCEALICARPQVAIAETKQTYQHLIASPLR
jgi:hypothetical protein